MTKEIPVTFAKERKAKMFSFNREHSTKMNDATMKTFGIGKEGIRFA